MTTVLPPPPEIVTVADLLRRLGGVPADRVRFYPIPGTATVQDVVDVEARESRLCELVDGVLVEKAMGYREALLAGAILAALRAFVNDRNLGLVVGADGMVRLFPGLVRIPDVAFASWDRVPGDGVPQDPVPQMAPDLVVEVLSPSNTPGEMTRKRREYFAAGVRLVWYVDPAGRVVTVFTAAADDQGTELRTGEVLDGGVVLGGFRLPVGELFAELDRTRPGAAPGA